MDLTPVNTVVIMDDDEVKTIGDTSVEKFSIIDDVELPYVAPAEDRCLSCYEAGSSEKISGFLAALNIDHSFDGGVFDASRQCCNTCLSLIEAFFNKGLQEGR